MTTPQEPPPTWGTTQTPTAKAGNGLAVTAMVLGIIGVLFGIIPLTFFIAWILGVLALVFGFIGRGKARRGASGKGQATAGIVLGVIALGLGVWGVVLVSDAVDDIDDAFEDTSGEVPADEHTVAMATCTVDEFGFTSATGTLRNTTDENHSYQITVQFFAGETRVGEGFAYLSELAPGQEATWEATDLLEAGAVADCRIQPVEYSF